MEFRDYRMMIAELYDLSQDELKDLKEKYQEKLNKVSEAKRNYDRNYNCLNENISAFDQVINEKQEANLRDNFKINESHLKLLKRLNIYKDKNDGLPCIDYKRPLGESNIYGSICEILGYDRDYEMTKEEIKPVNELAYALQYVIANFKI